MTRSFTEIKSAIAWQLKESIGEYRFDLWFGNEDAFTVADGQVTVAALDELSLSFVQNQFGPFIDDAVRAVLGAGTRVQFAGCRAASEPARQNTLFSDEELHAAGGDRQPAPNRPARNRRKPRRSEDHQHAASLFSDQRESRPDPAGIATDYSLESFEFGTNNRLLETALGETLAEPGKFNPLYLHGPTGCGKSHLLQAMITRARRENRYHRCVNVTAEQFTSGFIDALQSRSLTSFRGRYRNLDLLLVDDVQFLVGKEATVTEFQNTLETLLKAGRQVVITADRPVFQLNFSHEPLLTRLASGLACPVSWPDVAARQKIVQRLARRQQLDLATDVERLLSQRIGRDVRLLSGAVNRLKAASVALDITPDADAAGQLLADLFHAQQPVLSLTRIEQVVCDQCGVDASELKSGKRIKRISMARMLAMWLSRKHTSAGLAEIGKHYGGRAHSTVVAAEKKIESLRRSDETVELRTQRTTVEAAIRQLEHRLQTG